MKKHEFFETWCLSIFWYGVFRGPFARGWMLFFATWEFFEGLMTAVIVPGKEYLVKAQGGRILGFT